MRWLGDVVSLVTWGARISEPPFKKDIDVIAICTELPLVRSQNARESLSLFLASLPRGRMRCPQDYRHFRYIGTTPSCSVGRLGEPESERKDERWREEREFADEVSAAAGLEYCV